MTSTLDKNTFLLLNTIGKEIDLFRGFTCPGHGYGSGFGSRATAQYRRWSEATWRGWLWCRYVAPSGEATTSSPLRSTETRPSPPSKVVWRAFPSRRSPSVSRSSSFPTYRRARELCRVSVVYWVKMPTFTFLKALFFGA